jgi:hypothetical protein
MTAGRLHYWLSSACEVRPSLYIRGIFAREPIPALKLVVVWGGVVPTDAELAVLAAVDPTVASHAVCIGEGFYITSSPSGTDPAEMFNHSCQPNVGVKGQIVVIARRDILSGEELTFDYDPATGTHTLSFDDARFTNHSDDPNTANAADGVSTVAVRDIEAGEEITWDYRSFGRPLSFEPKRKP